MWRKLGLLTRVAFQESVPELLVVWREEGPDLGPKIHAVLLALVAHLTAHTSSETLAAAEEIDKSPVGTIIVPAFLAQRFNLTTDEAVARPYKRCRPTPSRSAFQSPHGRNAAGL